MRDGDSSQNPDAGASGFVVLRSPLLSVEELEAWGAGLRTPAAERPLESDLAADRELLRERLAALVARPEIREALFVASPSLVEALRHWRENPDGKKGRRAEESLVRYFQRMASRPTPFGIFAGCTTGTTGERTRLELAPRSANRLHTRLDMDYLFALANDLGKDPQLRQRLLYSPNTSLCHTADRWRYVESRWDGRFRSHHIVAVEEDEYVETALRRSAGGATVAEIVEALIAFDSTAAEEDAAGFVHDLIDAQILVDSLAPNITGPEPIHDLIEQLAAHPCAAPTHRCLTAVRDRLDKLDESGPGRDPAEYRGVAEALGELDTKVELPRLFQVDMVKPARTAEIGEAVLAEIRRGIGLLSTLTRPQAEDDLSRFADDFLERYENAREVSLVEALDEDVGVGFGVSRRADAAPLIEGLAFPGAPGGNKMAWERRAPALLYRLVTAAQQGESEVAFTEAEIGELASPEARPLPAAFNVMAILAAESQEAVDRGDFEVVLHSVGGPSGARLLGRFCHGDEALRARVEEHLRQEEALDPEAVFAEVVHLPEGRIGNVLARPAMRPYEIPYIGRGAADEAHRIPIADLRVSVVGRQVVLRSARLGRRVVPRLTSAHAYRGGQSIYRFLCALQSQGTEEGVAWTWVPFDEAPFLPRVRCGRLVLSLATWTFLGAEIQELARLDDAARQAALREWRTRRKVPRYAILVDADNELPVDFENVLSVDAFLALVRSRASFTLKEVYPSPDQLLLRGPEGRFHHQLVIPFVHRAAVGEPVAPPRPVHVPAYAPGSEWLYAKLYTGTATADRVLTDSVGPLVRELQETGGVDRWFFLRYGDPKWHLRVRFHGEPEYLTAQVLPRLHEVVAELLRERKIWRFQLDTYEPEVERYGGPERLALSERIFHADSEAALSIVEQLEGDAGAVARWQLALRGSSLLLRELGLSDDEQLALAEQLQKGSALEARVDAAGRKQLAQRLREHRQDVEAVLAAEPAADHPLALGFEILARRSRAIAPVVEEMRSIGPGSGVPPSLVASYIHMHTNRLLRSEGRLHEVVLYDFLYRDRLSRRARRRKQKRR